MVRDFLARWEPALRPLAWRGFAIAALFVSVAQGVVYGAQPSWTAEFFAGTLLAILTLVLSVLYLKSQRVGFVWLVMICVLLEVALYCRFISLQGYVFDDRLVRVALIGAYAATLIAALLAVSRITVPVNAMVLSCLLAVSMLGAELWLELDPDFRRPGSNAMSPVASALDTRADQTRVLGRLHEPNSQARIFYPSNPRGYFKLAGPGASPWRIGASGPGSPLRLNYSPRNDILRVRFAEPSRPWTRRITVYQAGPATTFGGSYALVFRARADAARRLTVFLNDRASGETSFEQIVELTTDWQDVRVQFIARSTSSRSTIGVLPGGDDTPFELSRVRLMRLPEGTPAEPVELPRHYVDYDFNGMGCRAGDYPIPRPPATQRILVLGDSYTVGLGVHRRDIYTERLESLLNERARADGSPLTYEVIGCGFTGSATREQRLFYERYARKYKPDLILVQLTWDDDMSYQDEREAGYHYRPGVFGYTFYWYFALRTVLGKRPPRDYTSTVRELRGLIERGRRDGARTAAVIFRAGIGQPAWKTLTEAVSAGLEDAGVPWLDLGESLLAKHSGEELMVGPDDEHPNEIAHRAAAVEILEFLQANRLLKFHGRPENLFVLLDNPDGKVGSILVKNAGGERVLDTPGQATGVHSAVSAPIAPITLRRETIRDVFGATFATQPKAPMTFVLYFEIGTTTLTDESRNRIQQVFDAVRGREYPVLAVVGHTDRYGSARSNEILALRRARTVADRLIAAGADAKLIEVSSHGENNPLIVTPDNVRELRNRRVEITVR